MPCELVTRGVELESCPPEGIARGITGVRRKFAVVGAEIGAGVDFLTESIGHAVDSAKVLRQQT